MPQRDLFSTMLIKSSKMTGIEACGARGRGKDVGLPLIVEP